MLLVYIKKVDVFLGFVRLFLVYFTNSLKVTGIINKARLTNQN